MLKWLEKIIGLFMLLLNIFNFIVNLTAKLFIIFGLIMVLCIYYKENKLEVSPSIKNTDVYKVYNDKILISNKIEINEEVMDTMYDIARLRVTENIKTRSNTSKYNGNPFLKVSYGNMHFQVILSDKEEINFYFSSTKEIVFTNSYSLSKFTNLDLLEFAYNHELGHFIYKHTYSPPKIYNDKDRDIIEELFCDGIGLFYTQNENPLKVMIDSFEVLEQDSNPLGVYNEISYRKEVLHNIYNESISTGEYWVDILFKNEKDIRYEYVQKVELLSVSEVNKK